MPHPQISEETLSWLLNKQDPGVRYLTMRDLLGLPEDDPDLILAQQSAHQEGPIARILDEMNPEGYWVEPGPGYLPKYRSSVWSLIMLAQLGASISKDLRIQKACRYSLEHALTKYGQFSASGTPGRRPRERRSGNRGRRDLRPPPRSAREPIDRSSRPSAADGPGTRRSTARRPLRSLDCSSHLRSAGQDTVEPLHPHLIARLLQRSGDARPDPVHAAETDRRDNRLPGRDPSVCPSVRRFP